MDKKNFNHLPIWEGQTYLQGHLMTHLSFIRSNITCFCYKGYEVTNCLEKLIVVTQNPTAHMLLQKLKHSHFCKVWVRGGDKQANGILTHGNWLNQDEASVKQQNKNITPES
jgi:hypothetical protein